MALWGWNFAGALYHPSDSFWLNALNAFSCCVVAISMWVTWRIHRRIHLQMTGRVFTMVTEPFGLIIVEGPVKEGRGWTITQWRSVGFLNFAGQLLEPKARGATMSRALFNLWVVLDPRMEAMPEEMVDELLEKLEGEFQRSFMPSVKEPPEERVE